MAFSTIKHRVDSLHINVGAGDGAIHLLVDPSEKVDDKPTVRRACLIDGGTGSGISDIHHTITRVKQNYFLSAKHSHDNENIMRFDSVVITHWDLDHYGGVAQLLYHDYEDQAGAIELDGATDQAEMDAKVQRFKDQMAPLQCRYFQYVDKSPTTTLYAPEWDDAPRPGLFGKSNAAKTLTVEFWRPYKDKFSKAGHSMKSAVASIEDQCNLCFDPNEMIGANFFNNARLRDPSKYPGITTAKMLNDQVQDTDGAPVGIYCIACRARVIGSDKDFLDFKKIKLYLERSGSEVTNKKSIAAIVLWRNPFKITHYFAGDAWWYVEEAIADWIQQSGDPGVPLQVPCMKLSHHGALNSTPAKMLEAFKPDNIVISAKDRHNHPIWSLLMYLNAWLYKTEKARAVFATWYPRYCNIPYSDNLDNDCKNYIEGESKSSARMTFWSEMEKLYKSLGEIGILGKKKDLKIQGLQEQAKEWAKSVIKGKNAKNNTIKATAWVTYQVQQAWDDNLSAMFPGRVPVVGPLPPMEGVDHILIRSELEDSGIKISVEVQYEFRAETFLAREGGKRLGERLKASEEAIDPKAAKPLVLYENIPTHLLPKLSESSPPLLYHLEDDTQQLRLLDETLHHTKALSTEGGYWLGPVDELGTNAISDQRLSVFVSHLHHRSFGLVEEPKASSQTNFLPNEEWNCWFRDALSSTLLQLSTNNQREPSGYLLEMKPLITKQAGLKFHTQLVQLAFDPPAALLPPLGLIGDTNIMVFGLDTTSGLEAATISEILSYIKLDVLKDSPLMQAYGDGLSLSLSTEKGARNAIWFEPGLAYRTTLRLQWKLDTQPLCDLLKSSGIMFDVTKAHLITSRITSWRPDLTMIPRGELRLDMTIMGPSFEILGSITARKDSFGVTITVGDLGWTDFLGWLEQKFTGIDMSSLSRNDSPLSKIKELFKTKIVPRRAYFEVQRVGGKHSLKNWSVSIEITIKSVAFLVTYSSALKLLRGQIWLDPGDDGVQRLLPGWEESDALRPTPGSKSELDLADLDPEGGVEFLPKNIPTRLREVSVSIDPNSVQFFASLVCTPASKEEPIPAISLGTVELIARYSFQGNNRFSLKLYCNAILSPPTNQNADDVEGGDDDDDDSASSQHGATLEGVLEYDEGEWILAGSINALSFLSIYSLLDPHAQDDVLSVLGKLKLSNLRLLYRYQKDGNGSDFFITGSLLLGKLELAMTYTYNSDGWSFTAELGSSTKNETVGTIIESIIGPDDAVLPDFIAKIPIAGGGAGDKMVTIRCRKSAKPGTPKREGKDFYILFQATLKIRVFEKTSVEVTFAQYRDLALKPTDPAKRILKVSLMELPTVEVPTLGLLPQPFDEMLFLWVQDKNTQAVLNNKAGLTEQEVKYINQGVPTSNAEPTKSSGDWLFYRDTRKPDEAKPTDLVITTGYHFMILLNASNQRRAILDYAFQMNRKQGPVVYRPYSVTAGSGANGNSAMAAYQKTAGPISINSIGLKYKDNVLSVLVDASFVLGPVGFTFLDAAITINLKDKTIQELTDIGFGLGGLVVAFERPPLRLAGMFIHGKTEKMNYWAGGIVVGFDPYQLTAVGMYGEVEKPKDFKTAFVFAKLEGPLVTLAFAEISGITGGFGYNSEIRKPTIETVREFAFFNSALIGNDLLTTLGNLMKVDGSGTFAIRDGSMWLAAGLKVSAFKMLSVDAVIVVSWNPSVIIAVYGVAVADLPKGTGVTFAHIELGIMAAIDFEAGVFKVEAQLAPSSYLFDSSCRLTGGFALFYWFNDRVPELQGDWVFTVGGYHRAFKKPPHYPNPPRLGISWQIGSSISIVGEAYFAVTPKCCMGGGRLRATLSAGPLTAWYSTWADFLIKYQPFYFRADAGVSIGISCKVDLLITSFTVSVEVGASLSLEGPPLHGRVHIDFWVMSFNINFGPDADAPDPPTLEGFHQMVLQSQDQQSLAATLMAPPTKPSEAAPSKQDHVFTCRGGLVEGEGDVTITKENAKWLVKAGSFAFAIDVHFALSVAEVMPPEEFGKPDPSMKPLEFRSTEKIYAKPMENNKEITSKLTVTVTAPRAYSTTPELDEVNDHHWQVTEIIKEVPSALWGEYDRTKDPILQANHVDSLLNEKKGTIPMLMGLEIRPPKPKLADDKIGKFDAVKSMELAVFTKKDTPTFPAFEDQRPDWSAASVGNPNAQASYDKVKKVWRETSETERNAVVDALAQGLAWRKKLTAATPKRLVDDLWNRYMCAPGVSMA